MNLDLSSLSTPEVLTVALVGVVVMFFGLKIKKVAFFLIWFVVGYYITTLLMPHLNNVAPEVIQEELYQTLIPIAGGLLLAMLRGGVRASDADYGAIFRHRDSDFGDWRGSGCGSGRRGDYEY